MEVPSDLRSKIFKENKEVASDGASEMNWISRPNTEGTTSVEALGLKYAYASLAAQLIVASVVL